MSLMMDELLIHHLKLRAEELVAYSGLSVEPATCPSAACCRKV